ncbi:hypothetical protein JCM5350_005851 [Sporobolomyces pararoseus]
MLPFGKPSVFYLTESTSSPLTNDHDNAVLTPRHSLNIHDLDGKGKEWVVEATVSKISIYNSKNFRLRFKGRIISSTIDVFQSSCLEISVENHLGTLQLDPTLENVSINYNEPSSIGKIVISPTRSSSESKDSGYKNLSFTVGEEGETTFILADKEGRLFDPQPGDDQSLRVVEMGEEQWVLSYIEEEGRARGWKLEGLKRGAMNYPIL